MNSQSAALRIYRVAHLQASAGSTCLRCANHETSEPRERGPEVAPWPRDLPLISQTSVKSSGLRPKRPSLFDDRGEPRQIDHVLCPRCAARRGPQIVPKTGALVRDDVVSSSRSVSFGIRALAAKLRTRSSGPNVAFNPHNCMLSQQGFEPGHAARFAVNLVVDLLAQHLFHGLLQANHTTRRPPSRITRLAGRIFRSSRGGCPGPTLS